MNVYQAIRLVLYILNIAGTLAMVIYLSRLAQRMAWAILAIVLASTFNSVLYLILLQNRLSTETLHPFHELLTTLNAMLQFILTVVLHTLFYQRTNDHDRSD